MNSNPKSQEAREQYAFTSRFEGIVPHIYLDSADLPTCGVGFLIADDAACVRLPWAPNAQAALADLHLVMHAERGHTAAYYRQFCSARLSEENMRAIFDLKMTELRRALEPSWRLSLLPLAARIALCDMGYNLGVAGLAKYKNLRAAVDLREWAEAAKECSRKGVQPARNTATRDLFLGLVQVEFDGDV